MWLQSRNCFTAIFVSWLCRASASNRSLTSLNLFFLASLVSMLCGSRAEVVSRQFLFPDSVERMLATGAQFCWIYCSLLACQYVTWLQSRSCFTAIFVSWLCRAYARNRSSILLNLMLLASLSVCCVAPEQKLFHGNFCFLTLSSVC